MALATAARQPVASTTRSASTGPRSVSRAPSAQPVALARAKDTPRSAALPARVRQRAA